MRRLCTVWRLALWLAVIPFELAHASTPDATTQARIVVIPVRAEISNPQLYLIRRGIKEAIERKADTVILDMETPGGQLDTTFEIIQSLNKFPGKTVTYVNREALSAGALIAAASDEIHFAPDAVIGAAAPVKADGADIEATMHSKMVSMLKARIRSLTEGKGYRAEVIAAMIDRDFELIIAGETLKAKGTLLTLTANEANQLYGSPAQPLLGNGTATDLNALIHQLHGPGNHQIIHLHPTWSEQLAQLIIMFRAVLIGLGILCLFIEFKTPGFGVFGVAGMVVIGLVFFGQYAAGLSGHEPALIFLLGLALITAEIFIFPGTLMPALIGAALVLGSLVWAMLDLWPGEPISLTGDTLLRPLANVLSGITLAILGFFALLRFLPKGGPWGGMVLETSVGHPASPNQPLHAKTTFPQDRQSLIGLTGTAATPLRPTGQVIINGQRYEAKLEIGSADAGTPVIVTGISEFALIMEVLT